MPTPVHAPQVYRPVEPAVRAATWPGSSPPANTHLSHNSSYDIVMQESGTHPRPSSYPPTIDTLPRMEL
eukprot:9158384-Prorocentrum_lima.AAC.1